MRRISLVVFTLIGLASGFALASGRSKPVSASPGCSGYKTYQTCNADLRCMWYGSYCGPRLE